MVTYNDFSLVD